MIVEVGSRVSKAPADNFTVAGCDACGAWCPQSRLPGRRGTGACGEAVNAAVALGWVERLEDDTNPRRRKTSWTVRLYCPACATIPPTNAGPPGLAAENLGGSPLPHREETTEMGTATKTKKAPAEAKAKAAPAAKRVLTHSTVLKAIRAHVDASGFKPGKITLSVTDEGDGSGPRVSAEVAVKPKE